MADKDEPNEKKSILLVTLGIIAAAFLSGQGFDEVDEDTNTDQTQSG
ncbi:hypothetical protein [Paenibacillus sp. KN14-4R]